MIVAHRACDIPSIEGRRGFVATMGFLHEGHMSLVHLAQQECDQVILSIYVNPTQFGPGEDYGQYPRDLERDLALAGSNKVDVVYLPETEEIYPLGTGKVTIHVDGLSDIYEGAIRPGHFDGVATVVSRLFQLACPNHAYFGQKDLQQFAVLERMVKGLGLPVDLHMAPIIREANGLAMSSRNTYLNEDQRQLASSLYRELTLVREAYEKNEPGGFLEKVKESRSKLADLMKVDYFDWVDWKTFQLTTKIWPDQAVIAAVRLGSTRLLDNVLLS